MALTPKKASSKMVSSPHVHNLACQQSPVGCAWLENHDCAIDCADRDTCLLLELEGDPRFYRVETEHLCNIDCGLSDSGCTEYEIANTTTGDLSTSGTATFPNTIGYMQVIPAVGKHNYRVEYRLGDDVKTIWVDADFYEFDDHGAVCTFFVDRIGQVFSATHVYSVTWVRDNTPKVEPPAPIPAPWPTPAPWAPTPPFLPPYRIGDFPPFPGSTITVWCNADHPISSN